MSKTDCCTYGCGKTCKEEFKVKNFGLMYDQPRLFVLSQCGPKLLYLVWAVFSAICMGVWFILDVSYINRSPIFFTQMTNWGFLVLSITALWNAIATCYANARRYDIIEGAYEKMTWYLKVLWIMFNISNTAALVITVAFFAFLSSSEDDASRIKHAFLTVYVLLNVSITAMPIRVLHFYQPMIFGTIFIIFSIVYQLGFNGGAIYPILDWTIINSTLPLALALLISFPFAHIIFYLIFQLRVCLAYKCCGDKSRSIEMDISGRIELQPDF